MLSDAPPVDPNWLLSTEAQSAAALVAIIGGFLVSRLVSLSSEREGLRRRRREVAARRDLTSDEYEKIHRARLSQSQKTFTDHHLKDVVQAGRPSTPESLLEWIPRGSSATEMRPVAERLVECIAQAREGILLIYPDAGPAFRRRTPEHSEMRACPFQMGWRACTRKLPTGSQQSDDQHDLGPLPRSQCQRTTLGSSLRSRHQIQPDRFALTP